MRRQILIILNFTLLAIYFVKADEEDEKIVGGVVTDIALIPYQVAIRRGTSLCGGSIIHERWIVTSVQCVRQYLPSGFRIHAGSNTQSGGTIYEATNIVRHPGYDPQSRQNDIALIKLSRNILFGQRVNKIIMATILPRDGRSAVVSGYGHTSISGNPSLSLLSAKVNIVNFNTCKKAYGNIFQYGMVCAAAPGKGFCLGDSGGPLAFDHTLIGVISFSKGCASSTYPGVYASIPFYRNWILRTIYSSPTN